jgi:single-stranded-DNA-specific exonuclease
MTKRWTFHPPIENLSELADALGVGSLLAQVMGNRGLTTPEACREFLHAGYEQLHRPEEMPGLEKAAERIVRAIRDDEKVAIYGDYDVDGLTASAILYQCLDLVGRAPTLYVPHRIEEGYGLNCAAIEQLAADGHTVIVTVDCGVTSIAEAARARELGVDLIITDHHEPERQLPEAYAIVDPKLPGSTYPFRDLAGVGVAFKLAWAIGLALTGERTCTPEFQKFLTNATALAALGTIADVVPLVNENRALVATGLKALSSRLYHPGLKAIVESARLADKGVKERDVAFIIGPRLNAAGRMGHARDALRLLTDASAEEAHEIARELEAENRRRQVVERTIFEQAVEMVEARDGPLPYALVLASPDWHAGVIGIVASRLVEKYHRPTMLIAAEEDYGQGSGRSIPGFSLFEALEPCGPLLKSFGGHAMAAGLRMDMTHFDAFAERLEEVARDTLTPADLVPHLSVDAETSLPVLTKSVVRELLRLAPFGQGNRRPVFAITGCQLVGPPNRMGKRGAHLSMQLTQGGISLRGVYWRAASEFDAIAGAPALDVAFRPRINAFRGRESVELDILDVHPGGYVEPTSKT